MSELGAFEERFRDAARTCTAALFRGQAQDPAEQLAGLAAAYAEFGIAERDEYGVGGAATLLEERVATLLGKPAAVFLPTGTMAQQAVLRAWCERQGSDRVALPDIAHPLLHESDGPRLLHGFRFEHLTTGARSATAADLAAVPGRLGAAMVELPLREVGCLAPTWDELAALSAAARARGVPLHVDGARIWEVAPHYPDRSLPELAAQFDSVYVSFYKGLGALAGAAVAADADVVDDVRRWRHRMGGNLFQTTPYALSALLALRDVLPLMPRCVEWGRAFAAALVDAGLRVFPAPPHSTTFLAYAEAPAAEIDERLLAFLERERVRLCGRWRAADVPGFAAYEFAVRPGLLDHDPAEVAAMVAGVTLG